MYKSLLKEKGGYVEGLSRGSFVNLNLRIDQVMLSFKHV